MDSTEFITFLAPLLPFLLSFEQNTPEQAIAKFGQPTWQTATIVWGTFQPYLSSKPDLQTAIAQCAAKPDSAARKAVLQEELTTLLSEHPTLTTAIAQILQTDTRNISSGTRIDQTVTGNQNQVIGQVTGGQVFGNVAGSIIMGGSGNNPPPQPPKETMQDEPAPVRTILVLAANPKGTNSLRLGEEVRKLQAALERSQHRDDFRVETCWAVTPTDVRRALLHYKPQIVHFSGHGIGADASGDEPMSTRKATIVSNSVQEPEGLIFEDETGQPKLVSGAAIADLLAQFSNYIECVVLNSCYSETQAKMISTHIPYVIGMQRAIGDRAAIEFAIGFYDALFAGGDVNGAYKIGCNAIVLEDIPEHLTPTIHKNKP